MNHPKGHKLEGLILVGDRNRILRRKGVEVPVYYFFHRDFVDDKFFALRRYIHMVEEVPEECIFDHIEALACERAAMQPIHGTEAENLINGSYEEGNLPAIPSGGKLNPKEEYMAILRCI